MAPNTAAGEDFIDLLQLLNPAKNDRLTCCGWAKSVRRRCQNPIAAHNRSAAYSIVDSLADIVYKPKTLMKALENLASLCLCRRYHQDQFIDVANEWYETIVSHEAELRHQESRPVLARDVKEALLNADDLLQDAKAQIRLQREELDRLKKCALEKDLQMAGVLRTLQLQLQAERDKAVQEAERQEKTRRAREAEELKRVCDTRDAELLLKKQVASLEAEVRELRAREEARAVEDLENAAWEEKKRTAKAMQEACEAEMLEKELGQTERIKEEASHATQPNKETDCLDREKDANEQAENEQKTHDQDEKEKEDLEEGLALIDEGWDAAICLRSCICS